MAQKSNLITLRPVLKELNLASFSIKNFILLYNFSNLLKFLFYRKEIILDDITLNIINNQFYLNIHFFYNSKKVSIYKRKNFKLLEKFEKKQILKNNFLSKLFLQLYSRLSCNIVILSFLNLNKKVKLNIILILYRKLKKFINTVFSRRFNLFIDFLKMNSLLVTDSLSLEQYLKVFALIFKSIQKKSHSRFFFFLKCLFKILVHDVSALKFCRKENFAILGLKFIIKGRIKGKPRASSFLFQKGFCKIQTISSNVEFAKTQSFTRLGTFGLRLWLLRKKINL